MKIYTKTGDTGETSLFGGERTSKDDLRIRAYGTYDELNASLGVALASTPKDPAYRELSERLLRVQGELFQLGAELATPQGRTVATRMIEETDITTLEREIDAMESKLSPLKTFILPGGSQLSALLHLSRTISRRAERELITLHRGRPLRPEVLEYSNRLSDYLFVCARFANHLAQAQDVPWKSR